MSKDEKLLNMLKDSEKVVGSKQVLRGLSEGTIRCVIVSEDAESAVKDRIVSVAADNDVQVVPAPSMAWLGEACGINVGAASVGIVSAPEAID